MDAGELLQYLTDVIRYFLVNGGLEMQISFLY